MEIYPFPFTQLDSCFQVFKLPNIAWTSGLYIQSIQRTEYCFKVYHNANVFVIQHFADLPAEI